MRYSPALHRIRLSRPGFGLRAGTPLFFLFGHENSDVPAGCPCLQARGISPFIFMCHAARGGGVRLTGPDSLFNLSRGSISTSVNLLLFCVSAICEPSG